MMGKRKFYCLSMAIFMSLTLTATVTSALFAAEVDWTFFTYLPPTDRIAVLYKQTFDDLFKSSNGRFRITLYSAGELPYKGFDVVKITASNKVQMAQATLGYVAGDVPELNVFSNPFLCTSYDGYFKAIEALAPIFEQTFMKKFRISVLFHWTHAPQNVWTIKPIDTLDDFRGMKIRTWNPQQVEMLKILGAIPVSISADEVATSIQRRIVQGCITSALSVYDWKIYEFLSNGLMINLAVGDQATLMNADAFNKLPKDLQQLLREKGKEWYVEFKKTTPEYEMEARKFIQEKGIKLNELSASDFRKARKMMRPMWEEWANKNGPVARKLLDEVTKMLEK
jgi:TRAP-type C4-dicarboxylate transport system substrate-binding protein